VLHYILADNGGLILSQDIIVFTNPSLDDINDTYVVHGFSKKKKKQQEDCK